MVIVHAPAIIRALGLVFVGCSLELLLDFAILLVVGDERSFGKVLHVRDWQLYF